MRHKEIHKQPCELKRNMCNYTNKNEARLNEPTENHKDKELLKCDMCRRGPKQSDADAQGKSQGEVRTKVSDVWQYLVKFATGGQSHY